MCLEKPCQTLALYKSPCLEILQFPSFILREHSWEFMPQTQLPASLFSLLHSFSLPEIPTSTLITEGFFKIWGAWNITSSLPNRSCSLHFFQHNAKQFKTWWNHLSKQWWTLGFTQTITVLVLSNADSLSDLTVLRRQDLKMKSRALITADILLVAWKNLFLI